MASDASSQSEAPQSARPVTAQPGFVPPGLRELRSQAVHRLQVGLFGLAAMLLLVGLANIIMDRAQKVEANQAVSAAGAPADEKAASDPLADIGVVPNADPSADSSKGR